MMLTVDSGYLMVHNNPLIVHRISNKHFISSATTVFDGWIILTFWQWFIKVDNCSSCLWCNGEIILVNTWLMMVTWCFMWATKIWSHVSGLIRIPSIMSHDYDWKNRRKNKHGGIHIHSLDSRGTVSDHFPNLRIRSTLGTNWLLTKVIGVCSRALKGYSTWPYPRSGLQIQVVISL